MRASSEAAARCAKAQYCDNEVDLTYGQFAWYEPWLMIDLRMIMKLWWVYRVVVDEVVNIVDDECGWIVEM